MPFQLTGRVRSGVYAMVGSASMLAGFKQMAVAVVVFITGQIGLALRDVDIALLNGGAANDLGLIPPLMLAARSSESLRHPQTLRRGVHDMPLPLQVTIALLLNKLINERGFDEACDVQLLSLPWHI